jgi:hypothetical protein
VANETERRVPRGADRLLSRWPEEHAGQKEIDLTCRVPGKTRQFIHLFCGKNSITCWKGQFSTITDFGR